MNAQSTTITREETSAIDRQIRPDDIITKERRRFCRSRARFFGYRVAALAEPIIPISDRAGREVCTLSFFSVLL